MKPSEEFRRKPGKEPKEPKRRDRSNYMRVWMKRKRAGIATKKSEAKDWEGMK